MLLLVFAKKQKWININREKKNKVNEDMVRIEKIRDIIASGCI